jgi:hypothetical protein
MKRESARYMSKCDTYRKVKANYIKLGELLQHLSILEWKWEDISMDYIVGLPSTAHKRSDPTFQSMTMRSHSR